MSSGRPCGAWLGWPIQGLRHFIAAQGTVELIANIAKDGSVGDISVAAGKRPLTDAATSVLSRWQFSGCNASIMKTCHVSILFKFVLLDGTCDSSNCPSEFQFDFPNVVTVTAKRFAGPVQ